MTFEKYAVVVVPFPFTDGPNAKRRPALVLSAPESFGDRIGHSVMAMITSAKNRSWPLDVPIEDLDAAGLPSASVIRMKLFTLDHRLIVRTIGQLALADGERVRSSLDSLLGTGS